MMVRHPLEEMQALRSRMNRLFDEGATREHTSQNDGPQNGMLHSWVPLVDVAETKNEIVLHIELPGMKKDEIDIQLSGDTLMISGERQREDVQRGEHFHRIERQYGRFLRSFQIETPVDASGVEASYDEGVLSVRLPKQTQPQARQIEIKTK